MSRFPQTATITATILMGSMAASIATAQERASQPPAQPGPAARGGRGPQGPVVVSPEILSDHRVVFRLLAPQADSVELRGGDLGGGRGLPAMTKGENGVWEGTTASPVAPGAYRYNFLVAGAQVL